MIGSAEVNSPYDNFALARYNSDGSFDQSFGNGGKILMATYGVLSAGVLQSDAKMIALGSWHLKRRSRLAHKILRQHERAAGAVICLTSLPSFGVLYPRNTKRG